VGAPRQPRAGIPISVKLILATSFVVAAAVGTAAWFGQRSIQELTESQMAVRKSTGERSIIRESELVVLAISTSVNLPLANNQYADLQLLIDSALQEDNVTGSKSVKWLVVLDSTGAPVARTVGAPEKDKLAELEGRLASGVKNGDVAHAQADTPTDWVYGAPVKLGGTVRMGVSTSRLVTDLQTSLAEAQDRAAASRNRVLLVSLVVLTIGIVLAALQGVQLAKPIKALTHQARRIAGGDLKARVSEDRRDELGVLAHTFNQMADEIRRLLVEQALKASLEKEMSLARQVQQAMLPLLPARVELRR
jgi:nitrogen fixation/metabolism regulation signal transduction histidine kinase